MIDEIKELSAYLLSNGDYVQVWLIGEHKEQEIVIAEWEPAIDGESDCYKETKKFTLDEIEDCVEYALVRHDKFAEVWNVE